jgi:8-oxo-dGTP diphosphatase
MNPSVNDIDWTTWQPTEKGTLCFVMCDGRILLIRKKRGLGSGKINGPGGRLELGETALEAAVRETKEEVGVTPTGLEEVGVMYFHFLDGYKLHVTVFAASGCHGQLVESDEATPIWTDVNRIPYHEMWQDDPYWMPLLLKRNKFRGYFVFDGEQLLSHDVRK